MYTQTILIYLVVSLGCVKLTLRIHHHLNTN